MLHRVFEIRQESHIVALGSLIRANWRSCLEQGQPLRVEVTQRGEKRSVEQNKRYFAMLRDIASQCWIDGKQYSDEVLHEFFKRKYIGLVEGPGGEQYGISTTKLSVSEFCEYMQQVERYAIEQMGWIPSE